MKLSIIISNRNDVVMLAVTFRSCIEELRHFNFDSEVVIVDNSDDNIFPLVKSALPQKYINEGRLTLHRQTFPCLFTAREKAAQLAKGKYIICLDSHMLVGKDTFKDLYYFMEKKSNEPIGFAHAPINWIHHHESRAKHDRDMRTHELGDWNNVYQVERKITWKGMPWICNREWFLDREKGLGGYGALADHKISWGGGDMHIGIKPWLLGFPNWAVPTNPCIHIGPLPKVDTAENDPHSVIVSKTTDPDLRYRRYGNSGNYPHTFGFLVSCFVLGGLPMIERNMPILKSRFGRYLNFDKHVDEAIKLGTPERDWLLKRQKLSFEQLLATEPWNEGM